MSFLFSFSIPKVCFFTFGACVSDVMKEDKKRTILRLSIFWTKLKALNDFLLVGCCGVDASSHTKNGLVLIFQLFGGQKRTKKDRTSVSHLLDMSSSFVLHLFLLHCITGSLGHYF